MGKGPMRPNVGGADMGITTEIVFRCVLLLGTITLDTRTHTHQYTHTHTHTHYENTTTWTATIKQRLLQLLLPSLDLLSYLREMASPMSLASIESKMDDVRGQLRLCYSRTSLLFMCIAYMIAISLHAFLYACTFACLLACSLARLPAWCLPAYLGACVLACLLLPCCFCP